MLKLKMLNSTSLADLETKVNIALSQMMNIKTVNVSHVVFNDGAVIYYAAITYAA